MSRKSQRRKRGDLGFVRVRVMAEYASSGLWLDYPAGVFRHAGIGYDALRVPSALATRFHAWIEDYWEILEEKPFDYEAFNQMGRELACELKAHLGAESYVEFVPENSETGIGPPEIIE